MNHNDNIVTMVMTWVVIQAWLVAYRRAVVADQRPHRRQRILQRTISLPFLHSRRGIGNGFQR